MPACVPGLTTRAQPYGPRVGQEEFQADTPKPAHLVTFDCIPSFVISSLFSHSPLQHRRAKVCGHRRYRLLISCSSLLHSPSTRFSPRSSSPDRPDSRLLYRTNSFTQVATSSIVLFDDIDTFLRELLAPMLDQLPTTLKLRS